VVQVNAPAVAKPAADATSPLGRAFKVVQGCVQAEGPSVDFEEYVAGNRRSLLRLAAVLCADARLADDVVADALGRAFEKWDRIRVLESPHAYVRKMVLNEYLGWRRRARRTAVRADLADLVDTVPDHADATADHDQLVAEVKRLPAKQRAALVLRYFEGLDYAEIADLLGSGENAVRSNVSRALVQLRIQLTTDDRSLSGAVAEVHR
jgi:RNA polymerase sigma-70 factor (sigma-E family)